MATEVAVPRAEPPLNALAVSATLNCLVGCAAGEITGMALGTALGWSNLATVVLAVGLAFLFGYSLTSVPLLRSGLALAAVAPIALAADTCRSRSWRRSTTPSCWRFRGYGRWSR